MKKMGIQTKLLASFSIMTIVFLLIFSVINLTLMSDSLKKSAKSNLNQLINIIYDYIKLNYEDNKEVNIPSIKKEIESIKFGESGYFFVIDSKGNAIIHPTSQGKNLGELAHIADIIKNKEAGGEKIYVQQTAGAKIGKKKLVVFKYIKELDWIIIGGPYLEELYKDVYFITNFIIIISATFLLIMIIIIIVLSLAISKPITIINKELYTTAINLDSASKEVSASSQELASGSSELASSVEEITASLEELQSVVQSNTTSINASETMMKNANNGVLIVTGKMTELHSALSEIDDNSKKIVKIIKVIDDIAFQTNILALNAAVEAARAGESGRGFAVVADQVKNLAQKSANAAKETADLIESAIGSVAKGKELGVIVLDTQNKTSDLTNKVTQLLDEINIASKEQLKGINQITQAVNQTNVVVQGTASSSEESSASAEMLLNQYEKLKLIVKELDIMVKGEKKDIVKTTPVKKLKKN